MVQVLVADDKEDLRQAIEEALRHMGLETVGVGDGDAALEAAKVQKFDLALLDLKMPNRDGLEVFKELKQISPETHVIVMTAYGSISDAMDAVRHQSVDYILKPFACKDLEAKMRRILERYNLIRQKIVYATPVETPSRFIGQSASIKKIRLMVKKIAPTPSPILILGESGTGKEVLAQEIHAHSPRSAKPFVAINCAALAEGVLESELFGHEKGSFTGATAQKMGLLETANGGTVLLDEIGELPQSIQVKLLRFLQEHEIHRVGGTKIIKADARIIAATNRNLEKDVVEKRFREDLLYRLNVIEITLPPLRDRMDDLPLLMEHFLNKYQALLNKKASFSATAIEALKNYSWPGNIRELENIIERALVLMTHGEEIQLEDLPARLLQGGNGASRSHAAIAGDSPVSYPRPGGNALQEMEQDMLRRVLEENHWNQTKAARKLGMKRSTLQYRLQKYQLLKTAP